ncbi:Werner syndrome ATP-dependent helicase homolog EC=3.6.4.12 [Rhizoctonia solani AG-1 IB]|uniref:RecQ protein n=1 Tax=Thanatephorus cucumeris (strain AG1-IB / isolate 7/3/14) TaxID=1108050 RepID=M5BV80_THACB|nr:Werner syndrome ATP-dependent helicase homolog EC=3.6.4.12 [Rhizoctonia solani AG-1 IB]
MVWVSFILPDTDFTKEERIDLARARGTQTPSIHEPLPDEPTINTALQAQPALTGQNINIAELARCLAVELRAGNVHTASVPPSTSPLPSSHIITPVEMEQSTAPLVTRDHKHILRMFTGNKRAEWSSRGQADAFALITERRRGSVLVILPTGAGKSFLFMGIPLLERGVVVVVFPLLSLLEDQKRTAERLKIPVTVWSPRTPSSVPDGLVFISVESVTKMFQTWCVLVQNNGRLTQIVFDEIHKVLEDQAFRDAMLNMHLLIEAAVPLVLLTATLAPTLEPVLLKQLGSPTVRVVCKSTQRPNISYHMAQYNNSKDALEALLFHVDLIGRQLSPGEGILPMDIDPTPHTEARIQHETEFMRRQAIQDAKEAQPINSQVARDARQAVDRRVMEANASLKAAVTGEMNVSLLMMIKKWMDNQCVFCMVFHFDCSAGHTLENCPREPGLNKHLDNFIKDGDKLSAS